IDEIDAREVCQIRIGKPEGDGTASLAAGGTEFVGLSIPDSGSTDAVGDPQLPVLRRLLSVPDGVTVTAEMTGDARLVSMVDVGIDWPLAPLQQPIVKLAGQRESAPLDFSGAAYQTDEFTPGETVRVTEAGKVAGQRVVLLEIAPIAYNPVAGAISVYDTLTFELNFEGLEAQAEPVAMAAAAEAVGGRLLIVAHDDFAGQLSALVNHKTSMGWTVDLIDTTTAGVTNTGIRNTIQSRYTNAATRPDALLLVGDTDRIPHFIGSGEGNPATDLYYGCMDGGDDWFPEFPVGRMSVADAGELAAVVAKTITYETASAGIWTNRAAFMAGIDNNSVSEGTHNWVIDAHMDPLGYTSDKLYEVTYGATTQDVRNAFNEGRALGIYSGHGSEYSWADGPQFSQADVRNLTNDAMYPLVASFSCVTGTYTLDECFTETWLRVADKGAVAVVGSSVNSYWTEDDVLQKKLFDAIYDEGYVGYGNAWMRAKELFLEYFGVSPTTRRYFEMYNMLGDPTVEVLGLEFGIRSPAELPLAHLGEAYQFTLEASSGTAPYTWNLAAGSLPAGLSLDGDTGVIGGTATSTGTVTFTVEVTDATAATDSREFSLPVATRLQIITPSGLPDGVRDEPYDMTLAALGGSAPYRWSLVGTGQYEESEPGPGFLGGGTERPWYGDDESWNLALPWSFEFYGTAYNSVNVCSNGFLDFVSTSSEYGNSRGGLLSNVRIAPFWDDLYIHDDGGVLVTATDDYVVVRWNGETYDSELPVDFEAVLTRDGQIAFSYDRVPAGVSPTIGLSGGDGTHYVLSSLDGNTSIASGESLLFTYASLLPDGVVFHEATGRFIGTPSVHGIFELTCRVEDAGAPSQSDLQAFTLTISDLPPLIVDLPESATEGDGSIVGQGTVSVRDVLTAPLVVTLTSQDPTEVTLPIGAAVILPGHTSANFNLVVREDAILDGTQVAAIVASAVEHSNGTGRIAVHDNETATLTVNLLADSVAEDAGLLTGWGEVRVSATPASNIEVTLVSDDETELTLSPTVTIPAGQRSAWFSLTVVDDTEIDLSQQVTITARVENWTAGSDTIEITDSDHYLEIALPAKVWEGQATLANAGTITLGGTLPGDLVVSLASDRAGELAVPATATVPAGQLSAHFDLIVADNQDFDGSRPVQITGIAAGFPDVVADTTLGDDELHHFAVTPVANPQTANVPFSVTLAAKDVNGGTIEIFDAPVELTAAGSTGPLQVEINAGTRHAGASAVSSQQKFNDAALQSLARGEKHALGVYHNYAQLTTELADYAAAYPEISQLVSIGQSVEGRELWAMKITDNPALEENEPEVKYVGTMHGDEPVGTEMLLYFIDELLGGYGVDPRLTALVDETEIWVVPLMNPDGRESGSRENASAVDLNRDFPDGAVAPIGNVFDGPAMDLAGRQAEVAAVMAWSAEHSFALSANLHTGALVVNYPYDNDGLGSVNSPTPDDALFRHLAETYASHNLPMLNSPVFPGGVTNGAAWYSMEGGMQDWNYRYLGCNEFTVELSDDFWPNESALPGLWGDNRESMLSYFESVHTGVGGLVADATTGEPVFAKVTVAANTQPVYTDPDLGDYHRMLLPGSYDLTVSAPGYAPRTLENVVVVDGATTPLDVVLLPLDAGIMFIDGQWTGNVQIDALATGVVLTVDDNQGHTGASNAFSLTAGPVDRFQFSEIASPQHRAHPIDLTLTALDANGYVATDFNRQANLSGAVGAGEVAIGTGTYPWEFPMATYYHDARTQVIYLSSELGPATTITGLALNVTEVPGQTLKNWTIRVKHTPLDSYGDALWQTTGWTTAYRANSQVAANGWTDFQFSTPFAYNGVHNLMIDFSFNNNDYTTDGLCRATDTGEFRSISYESDSYDGDPLTWSDSDFTSPYLDTLVPNIRLTVGESVSISPTVTTAFSGGLWSGQITVNEAAAGMRLRVDDGEGHVGSSSPVNVNSIPSLAIEMAGSATEGDGTLVAIVTIPYSLPGNLAVAITSNDASEVVVPSPIVTIPAGLTSAEFGLQIQDDAVLDGTQGVLVIATAPGYLGDAATLAVHDSETATLYVTLPAAAAEGDGVLAGQGTVTLSAAPQSDVDVYLISGDDTEVTVPPVVTVPAGQTSAPFDLTVVDDGEIDFLQSAVIIARVENWTAGTDSIAISDNEELILAVSFNDDFWEGDGLIGGGGTVSIPGTLTEPLEVSLTSNDTREMEVPLLATIPAGSTLVRFDVTVMNDAIEDGAQPVTVTARAESFTPGVGTVDVGDNEAHHFVFETIDSPQETGLPLPVTIYAREINDLTIGSYTGKVSLSGVGDNGAVVVVTVGGAGPAETDAMVDGAWNGYVTIATADVNVVLTADDGLGHTGTSDPFDVIWLPVFTSTNVPRAIPDLGTVTSTLTVPDTLIVTDVNVELSIAHTWNEDLDVYLIGPDNTRVRLFTDVGDDTENFFGTILDDEADVSITAGTGPFTGSFRPEGSLGNFDGKDARGTWTLEVTDDEEWLDGTLESWSLTFTERTPRIVGRRLFYDGSAFDGDLAVATDKVALRGARAATFANYSSYSGGISGIMVDVANVPEGVTPSAADFLFHVGNDDTPGDWTPLAVQPTVTVRAGDGSGGSDRVTLTWPAGTIRNTWLQVTVNAANLGLPSNDVFYFGNAVAEAGDSHADAKVTAADLLLARNNPRGLGTAAEVDFRYDYNRDAAVDATDVLLARNSRTSFLDALKLIDLSGGEEEAQAASLPPDLAWFWELQQQDEKADRSGRPASIAAVEQLLAGAVN
ncbi:MAG: proprotein convertase P-domain-containing protein, partial [Candidatus Nealsonbacteria bacterium]|nr:proprotein convertase P-domain-containing protein [Candidatus Nealsonbacteria bacterium]